MTMKTPILNRSLWMLTLAAMIAVQGCSDDDNPAGNTTKGSVSAKVNGTAWSANQVQATYQSSVLGIGGSQISGAENKQINISGLVPGTGTYQLGLISPISLSYTEGTAANVKIFTAKSGTLKVDELSASGAKGSFSFTGQEQSSSGAGSETRSVTDGTFDVKF